MNRQKYFEEYKKLTKDTGKLLEKINAKTHTTEEMQQFCDNKRRIFELTAILFN